MAVQIEANKVYKCQSAPIGSASIHLISGSFTLKGSNVTQYGVNRELVTPAFADLIETGDVLDTPKVYLFTALPEWIGFEGTGEAWIKMGIDSRYTPGD